MYDLHNLGWNSFQQLCLTITREVLGQTVESFLDSNDGGRDGAFTGQWNPTGHENLTGQFVIQCKFTSRINYVLRASDLADEVTKVKRLLECGLCDSYVLMTNAGLSGSQAETIEDLIRNTGVKNIAVLGSTWINQQIHENKRLRMLVPRLYGLGDLSQILDERAYSQARSILESLQEDLAKVVVTDAYRKAVEALDKYGFVLLIGEPAAGKTTIASMLAMAAIDQWNASVLKLDDPGKVIERWNPEEPSQFFWLDDAFGVSQYEAYLVHSWNHILPQINTMLRKGSKIVMTSRDYVYNRARKELKESAFPLLRESKVVIDAHDLSVTEKRQILYNHLKLGKQPHAFRSQVKPYLESIAAHGRFIPEIARRLSDPLFTKGLYLDSYHLSQFVEKREQFLSEILQGLDPNSKAALALIYMRNDRLESPIILQKSEEQALDRLGSNIGNCLTTLESLKGSLAIFSHAGNDSIWHFKHPTIGDAYAAILAQSPELLGVFLMGITPDKMIEQVTCGDVGIEKAVIIPKGLFPDVLVKLLELTANKTYKSKRFSGWDAKSAVQSFLTHRCSKEFLSLYLGENPDLLDKVCEPGLYLNAVPEVGLAVLLYELGLLPEEKRKKFVTTVSEYAIQGDDLYALDNLKIQSVFKDHEFDELLEKVHTHLLPRLDEVRQDVEYNHQSSESPDEYMQSLLEAFDILKKHFGEDIHAKEIIDEETRLVNEWIADNMIDEPDMEPQPIGKVETIEREIGLRSIFDDVDT
jgi:hypothetical protein